MNITRSNLLLALMLVTEPAWAVIGSMTCKVTGNVVVASEEGKFKQYSGLKDGVKNGEEVKLAYSVSPNSVYIGLERMKENGFEGLTGIYLAADAKYERSTDGGIIGSRKSEDLSLMPDYIRVSNGIGQEFYLSRYYKSDWHGIYVWLSGPDHWVHTMTLNCRHNNDQMDTAFKEFKLLPNKK